MNPRIVIALLVAALAVGGWFAFRPGDEPGIALPVTVETKVGPAGSWQGAPTDGAASVAGAEEETEQTNESMELGDTLTSPDAPHEKYFALPEGPQRVAYLDQMIDETEKARKEMERIESVPPGPGEVRKIVRVGGGDVRSMKQMQESLPPEVQARMAAFSAAVKKRRAERGLPDGPVTIFITRTENDKP